MADYNPSSGAVDFVLGADPVVEAYKPGIDRTLLRENLRRSVQERVAALIELQRLSVEARSAIARDRNAEPPG